LITGAAGFIGRNLWHELEGRGCDVVGVDDLSVAPRVPHRPETVLADVKTLTSKNLSQIDVIVHLAAYKSVSDSFRHNDSVERNLGPAHHLIRLFLRSNARRLLLASTCEVYGSQSRASIPERASMRPHSPYAVSKSAIEQLAGVYRTWSYPREISVVRLFNVYGPDENTDAVVPAFIEQLLTTGTILIEGSGAQRRDFSYIGDVRQALAELALCRSRFRTVNVGSGVGTSVHRVASQLVAIMGHGTISHVEGRPNEINSFVSDTNRLVRFVPTLSTSLSVGLTRTVRSFGRSDFDSVDGKPTACRQYEPPLSGARRRGLHE
jgi:dTDP-glucose 4,6-dehydratase/UDP-glucose 4-epimerase